MPDDNFLQQDIDQIKFSETLLEDLATQIRTRKEIQHLNFLRQWAAGSDSKNSGGGGYQRDNGLVEEAVIVMGQRPGQEDMTWRRSQ